MTVLFEDGNTLVLRYVVEEGQTHAEAATKAAISLAKERKCSVKIVQVIAKDRSMIVRVYSKSKFGTLV